jgi:glycosyltransferase involved in cell wall biosynthesis
MTACADDVAILMCTHNGARFLAPQLESFRAQTWAAWRVHASDDASSDDTVMQLQRYRSTWGADRLDIRKGPGRGFTGNFLSLACAADIQARFFAFSDQDDVWETDKLARAVAWLKTVPAAQPALYCSRTRLIDEAGAETGLSPDFTKRPPSFANALVQSLAGGNTMVFNAAARALLVEAGPAVEIVSHDWWLYQLVTGTGGRVFYDLYPAVRYRQHGRQLVGNNVALAARLSRAALVFQGRFKQWSDVNVRALARMEHRLTPENHRIFAELRKARAGGLANRLAALKRSGVHRQGFADNVGLYLAAVMNRL